MTNNADKIAKLEAEVAALKAAQPKPQKSFAELEQEAREYASQMHELREGRMAYAIHPATVRDLAGGVSDADARAIAGTARAPTGPTTMSPSAPPVTARSGGGGNVPGGGTGWSREIPIGPSMHQRYVDAQLDAADARDKAERVREQAQLRAADRLEALAKLAEQKK
jgi:hypothetical protein